MEEVALIALGVLAVVVVGLFLAALEIVDDVRQVHYYGAFGDRPQDLDMSSLAHPPSEYGLPAALDTANALVLFLSTKCVNCRGLAAGLHKSSSSLPPGLWIVVDGRNQEEVDEFIDTSPLKRLRSDGRVLLDVQGRIASRMKLKKTPAGFRVENGKFVNATTVPSSRYLRTILPKLESTPSTTL